MAGAIALDLRAKGPGGESGGRRASTVSVELKNGAYSSPDLVQPLRNLESRVVLGGGNLELQRLAGALGSTTFEVSGARGRLRGLPPA